jgi:hypothetical protein
MSINKSNGKTRFENINDLVKILIWPLFAVLLLVCFWKPLFSLINKLPEIIDRSQTVTIAGLAIELNQNMRQPSEEVKIVLSEISPEGVKMLTEFKGTMCWWGEISSDNYQVYEELIRLGLFAETSSIDLKGNCSIETKITNLGLNTKDYLFELLSEFVGKLNNN